MPSLKTRSPLAARRKQLVEIVDLTGGVDIRRSQTLLDPSRSRTCRNFGVSEPGALTVEPGHTQVSTAAFGTVRPSGGARAYISGNAVTLMAIDGSVYKPSDAWARGAAVYSTVSTANEVYFPYDRDLAMVMDSTNRPRFTTNGTDWFLAGTDAPSSAATLSSVSTGALASGVFEIKYSYKHRGTQHVSNPSTSASLTLAASSGAIHATASPSTDPKNDAYVWWARKVTPDLESIFRKFSSGAASTVTINSSAWTANDEAPSNHNVPPNGLRFGVSWKSRWWAPSGSVGNRLHFTELFQPQSWPTLYFIDIPFEKGDSITNIQPLGDTLIVSGQSGKFLIIGQTSLDFEVRPSQGAESGSVGPRAAARVEQTLIAASADGVESFDGSGDRQLHPDIQPAWRDLVGNVNSSSLERVAVVHDRLRQIVRFAVPRAFPTSTSGEWILDLGRTRDQEGAPAWTQSNRDVAFYIPWDGNEPTAGNRGRLFFVSNSTSAHVYELRGGQSADASVNSSNVVAEYEGPAISLGLHRARVMELHGEYEPHGGAFSIEVLTDGISQGTIPISIGAGLAKYGTAVYGTGTYGGSGRRKFYTPLPLTSEGRTAIVKATYTGAERFKIYNYALSILPEVSPRTASE
jgi:hypothetical protein